MTDLIERMKEALLRLQVERANAVIAAQMGKVNRVEVIDNKGRAYTKYNVEGVYCQLQDDGKTLKVFVQYKQEEDIQND